MKVTYPLIVISLLLGLSHPSVAQSTPAYQSEDLVVSEIAENTFIHITYLQTESFGKVACNGLIVVNGNEAVIVDTPVNDSVSTELIHWVREELDSKVTAVVATHFHDDCLGGLRAFHDAGIPSYANDSTISLATRQGKLAPEHGFRDSLRLPIGKEEVLCQYFGEGHTVDNTICYVPSEKVLFGGCLVKAMGANQGNLEDANPKAWPSTVSNVKQQFADVALVVPGHGDPGDSRLLDYTIELFSQP